jgi:hypothetical protein
MALIECGLFAILCDTLQLLENDRVSPARFYHLSVMLSEKLIGFT